MIALARESRGIGHKELATKLNITRTTLWRWEGERFAISESQREELASALGYPESFFFQEGEQLPLLLSYRKKDNISAKLINIADANMNIIRLNLSRLFSAISYTSQIPFIDLKKFGTPQGCAKQLRKLWNVPKGPIENLAELLESHNIPIMPFNFETERIDGRSIVINNNVPLLFINKRLLGDRQRFTLAYQLAYIVIHSRAISAFEKDLSHQANLFAAEFLMPEKDITDDLKEITLSKLGELKRKWKVSMQSILYRANDLGWITDNQKRYFLQQFNQMGIRRREPLEFDVPTEDCKIIRDLITNYKTKQKFNVKQLANFFDLQQEDFLARYTY